MAPLWSPRCGGGDGRSMLRPYGVEGGTPGFARARERRMGSYVPPASQSRSTSRCP